MSALIACSLAADDLNARLKRIDALSRTYWLGQDQRGSELRLRYAPEARDELREIVRLESECCAFLKFDVIERVDALELTIIAPNEAGEASAFLFEHFMAAPTRSLSPLLECATACTCSRAAVARTSSSASE